jgi:hypothetical protein
MHVNRTIINEDIMNLNVVENDGVRGNFLKNGNFTTSTVANPHELVVRNSYCVYPLVLREC